MQKRKMYVCKEGSLFVLRQSCFASQLAEGREHPNDICAYAGSLKEMRALVEKYWSGDIDYSKVDSGPT